MKVLNKDKENAIKELKVFITLKAKECMAYGWNYHLCENAPERFKGLKEKTLNYNIPISKEGSNKNINGSEVNNVLRFWHDDTHVTLNKSFSEKGELAVIKEHLKDGKEYGLSNLALFILKADTEGQVKYYFKHKEFVNNQAAFIDTCIQYDIKHAMRFKH